MHIHKGFYLLLSIVLEDSSLLYIVHNTRTHTHTHTHTRTHTHTYMHTHHVHAFTPHVCTCMCTRTYMHTHVHMYMHVYTHMCTHAHLHHTYMHTHTHIHIHTHTHSLKRPPNEVEKPQASSTSKGSTLKSALQELRKKGSAISVFSGLSTSTSEQLDPFDKFSEDAKKREGSLLGSGKSNQMGDTLDMNPESGNDLEGTKWSVGPELASTAAGSRCHISLGRLHHLVPVLGCTRLSTRICMFKYSHACVSSTSVSDASHSLCLSLALTLFAP